MGGKSECSDFHFSSLSTHSGTASLQPRLGISCHQPLGAGLAGLFRTKQHITKKGKTGGHLVSASATSVLN